MREAVGLGANLVGGCCGTTPLHIKELSQVVAAFCQKKEQKEVGSITKDGGIQQTDEGADNQATAKGESRYGDKSLRVTISDLQHTNGLTTVQPIDHNPILQRMTQGQKLIAVEYDSPATPDIQAYFAGALAIEAAGADTDHR